MEERAPMCGIPYHTYENYMNHLLEKSYKVAICEQVENPKIAKGLVKREVLSEDTQKKVRSCSALRRS